MPELSFFNIANSSFKAIRYECASPQEAQEYESALVVDVPEGHRIVVRRGTSEHGRTTLTLGCAPVGGRLVLEGEDAGIDPKANAPVQAPEGMTIPPNVKNATDGELERMAAANGVRVDPTWVGRTRTFREGSVAKAMLERKKK